MGDCDTEQTIYWVFVYISLSLSAGLALYRRCQKVFFFNDPNTKNGAKALCAVGGINVILGILLLTTLYPVDCFGFDDFYGAFAIMQGLFWLGFGAVIANREILDISAEMTPMDPNAGNNKDVEVGIFSW